VAPYFGFSLAMEALPKSRDLLWQIPVFFAIEDFYFYWVHRGLYHKRVYKYVHKIQRRPKNNISSVCLRFYAPPQRSPAL